MTKEWVAVVVYSRYMLDKGIIHFSGGTELEDWKFHPAIQNSAQFKTSELCFSGIFLLMFSGLQLTKGNCKPPKVKRRVRGEGGVTI